MKRLPHCPRPALVLALAFAAAALFGCEGGHERYPVRTVVIEGIVVPGKTFRLDRVDPKNLESEERGLPAVVRVQNAEGLVVESASDDDGRFRVGPIAIGRREGDILTVTSPSTRTLHQSFLFASEVAEAAPGEITTLRRKITLPPVLRTDGPMTRSE